MSDYDAQDDFAKSLDVGYAAIRERVAAGGEPWTPTPPDPFAGLPRGHFGAILADPPWAFPSWSGPTVPARRSAQPYLSMPMADIGTLPVAELCAPDCVLFLWVTWPMFLDCLKTIDAWGFTYKTCAFAWIKANASQMDLFRDDLNVDMRLGYWTRSNSEVCLLATRGNPKRLNADVRQGIIAPRREHSRKPDCVHERIERLVAGPYLELFARQSRPGWTTWGNEATKFDRTSAVDAGAGG